MLAVLHPAVRPTSQSHSVSPATRPPSQRMSPISQRWAWKKSSTRLYFCGRMLRSSISTWSVGFYEKKRTHCAKVLFRLCEHKVASIWRAGVSDSPGRPRRKVVCQQHQFLLLLAKPCSLKPPENWGLLFGHEPYFSLWDFIWSPRASLAHIHFHDVGIYELVLQGSRPPHWRFEKIGPRNGNHKKVLLSRLQNFFDKFNE